MIQGSKQPQYEVLKRELEKVLIPFYRAKKSGWQPKLILEFFDHLLKIVEKENWFISNSVTTGDDQKFQQDHYRKVTKQSALLHICSLCDEVWLKDKINLSALRILKLDDLFNSDNSDKSESILPNRRNETSKLKTEKSLSLKQLVMTTELERTQNRKYWTELATDLYAMLNDGTIEHFEEEPIFTLVFSCGKSVFRKKLYNTLKGRADHKKLCGEILASIFYSKIYDIKKISETRTKKIAGKKINTLNPLDQCIVCESVINSQRKRADSKFCDQNCRNKYNQKISK